MGFTTKDEIKDMMKKVLKKTLTSQQDNDYDNVPFKFGIDADGNYGYIKDGADSVTPFKQQQPSWQVVNSGAVNETASWAQGIAYVYSIDSPSLPFRGYGMGGNGWGTSNGTLPSWISATFDKPLKLMKIRIAYLGGTSTDWVQEGYVSLQASNDNFTDDIVTIATDLHLAWDDSITTYGYYGVCFEGEVGDGNYYTSYRVIGTDSRCFTGINKMQITKIMYYGILQD